MHDGRLMVGVRGIDTAVRIEVRRLSTRRSRIKPNTTASVASDARVPHPSARRPLNPDRPINRIIILRTRTQTRIPYTEPARGPAAFFPLFPTRPIRGGA